MVTLKENCSNNIDMKRLFISIFVFMVIINPVQAHESAEHHSFTNASSVRISGTNIIKDDLYRYITSNGLPNHDIGNFPNQYNPNKIQPQEHEFRVTLFPEKMSEPKEKRGVIGVALNGIPFEPGTNEFWKGDRRFNYEAIGGSKKMGLDINNAHVQANGTYHYHGIPPALVNMSLSHVGYAADGHRIYVSARDRYRSSYRLKQGNRKEGPKGRHNGDFTSDYEYIEGRGDLDECNGTVVNGEYVYFATKEFPFLPRCLFGEVDPSFERKGPSISVGPRGEMEEERKAPPPRRYPPRRDRR